MTAQTHTQTYEVAGMSCGHCEVAIRSELATLPQIEEVQVSSKTGILTVTASSDIPDADIIAAVDEAGYTATRS